MGLGVGLGMGLGMGLGVGLGVGLGRCDTRLINCKVVAVEKLETELHAVSRYGQSRVAKCQVSPSVTPADIFAGKKKADRTFNKQHESAVQLSCNL